MDDRQGEDGSSQNHRGACSSGILCAAMLKGFLKTYPSVAGFFILFILYGVALGILRAGGGRDPSVLVSLLLIVPRMAA